MALNPEIKNIEGELLKVTGWMLDPTHIVLGLLLAAVSFVGIYMYNAKRADAAEAKSHELKAIADEKDKENTLVQQNAAAQIEIYKTANAQLAAQNITLARSIASRNQNLIVQQKQNEVATPTQQSQRWQTLVPAGVVAVTPTGFQVDFAEGLATLQELERVPVLSQNVSDLNKALANDEVRVANAEISLGIEKTAHLSDNGKNVARIDQLNQDVDTAKQVARKSKAKWFLGGFISGLITSRLLGL